MKFKLNRKVSSQIVKDQFTSWLGFGTKKERIDSQLDNYKRIEQNNLQYLISEKNVLLAKINARINYLKQFMDNYEVIIGSYNKIISLAEEEVKKGDSFFEISLLNLDGTLFAKGNYYVLKDIIKHYATIDNAAFLAKQLEDKLYEQVINCATVLINGKGVAMANGQVIKNYDIFSYYNRSNSLIEEKVLKNMDNYVFSSNSNGFQLFEEAKDFAVTYKLKYELVLNKLNIQKLKLNNIKQIDERALEEIELAKNLILNSQEYALLKASDEYIKKFR